MNAMRMLREFDIGFLPVIDDPRTRKLIGVVTDRDLCLAALGELRDPTLNTVENYMATDLVCFSSCTGKRDPRPREKHDCTGSRGTPFSDMTP